MCVNCEMQSSERCCSSIEIRSSRTDFTTLTRSVEPTQFRLPPEGVNLEDVERQLLTQALERAGGNQSRAAQLLGINRDQVRYRLEKFGLKA